MALRALFSWFASCAFAVVRVPLYHPSVSLPYVGIIIHDPGVPISKKLFFLPPFEHISQHAPRLLTNALLLRSRTLDEAHIEEAQGSVAAASIGARSRGPCTWRG